MKKDATERLKLSGHTVSVRFYAEPNQDELNYMTSQIDAYLQEALSHLMDEHLGEVMRALTKEIGLMTSDMGYYLSNQSSCDEFLVAAEALKRGLKETAE